MVRSGVLLNEGAVAYWEVGSCVVQLSATYLLLTS
jgi:hypothetical protein